MAGAGQGTAEAAKAAASSRLSLVMTVRDVAPFLDASIASIVGQTFGDFEFIVRDDGSKDGSRDILRDWQRRDSRIRLFESDVPLGPAGSSNFVVAQARGELVARMDGDDVSHPDRLRRQFDTLARRPDACLVGSLWEGIDEQGRVRRPRDRSQLRPAAPFAPFAHGSIMYRRAAFESVGGYRACADFWEDLDLYRRLASVGRLLVLTDALYQHRASPLSTRLTSSRPVVERAVDRMFREVTGADGPSDHILPQVFVSLGATSVWAGRRPGALWPLLRRGALRLDRNSIAIVAWAAWAEASPRSLRRFLALAAAIRDRKAARRLPDPAEIEWVPLFSGKPVPRANRPPPPNADARGSFRPGQARF